MLIQSPPGTGKTWFKEHSTVTVYDGDDFTDGERSFAPYSECKGSTNEHFVDSRWYFDIGLVPDVVFVPHRDTWLNNIRKNRSDLIDVFGEEKLISWHDDYVKCFVDFKSSRTPIATLRTINIVQGVDGELLTDALTRSKALVAPKDDKSSVPITNVEVVSIEPDYQVYENNDKESSGYGTVRVVVPQFNAVVKLFDQEQGEKWSLKFWKGSTIQKVASHWNTAPTSRSLTMEEQRLVEQAISTVKQLLSNTFVE